MDTLRAMASSRLSIAPQLAATTYIGCNREAHGSGLETFWLRWPREKETCSARRHALGELSSPALALDCATFARSPTTVLLGHQTWTSARPRQIKYGMHTIAPNRRPQALH